MRVSVSDNWESVLSCPMPVACVLRPLAIAAGLPPAATGVAAATLPAVELIVAPTACCAAASEPLICVSEEAGAFFKVDTVDIDC